MKIDVARGKRESASLKDQRRRYSHQGITQSLGVIKDISSLSYDSKVVERRKRLRREIEEIKWKMSLYNYPISTDNFL
jgi:hypothetical protein